MLRSGLISRFRRTFVVSASYPVTLLSNCLHFVYGYSRITFFNSRFPRGMGHRDESYYRWRCMLTATQRTAISTKDASFDSVWGQNSLVFLLCLMFSLRLERNGTSKMIWDFENGTSNFFFRLFFRLQTLCQKKRQWARNTLVFVSSRYANAFMRYCILNVFLHA